MTKNYQKSFMGDAMIAGFCAGIALFIIDAIGVAMKWGLEGQPKGIGWLQFAIIVGAAIYFGLKRSRLTGSDGLSYGQGLGFIVASMVFAGIIAGLGQIILAKLVAPEYYAQVNEKFMGELEKMLYANPALAMQKDSDRIIEIYLNVIRIMLTNPFILLISHIFAKVIYGTFVGLFVAAFIKRPADVFADTQNSNNE